MQIDDSCSKVIVKLFTASILLFSIAIADEQERSLVQMANDSQLQWGPCPVFLGEGCELAVLHGDPSKPNSDVFFKVPGDYKIVHHWHTSAERMVLVSGTMDVTYDGESTNTLVKGSYAYGPAKRPHNAYCHQGEACILFIAFEEPIDAFEVR